MRVPFYDIKAQYTELSDQIDGAVHKVVSSGSYMMAENHNRLEEEIAALHRCRHGIALNSGTDALRIMLDAHEIGRGDEVVTTAFTFVASAEVIVAAGAAPVFVDIDPETLMIDASKIDAAVTERTKAIMPIHLFGQLGDMDGVTAAATRHGLIVLEDAAQAIGCHHHGTFAGNFGQAAGLSFYVTKNLGAAGDAGMILTNDDEVADKCRSIRVHGMGRQRYYYDHVGYTSRMDEVQAAVLRVKLTRLAEWNELRNRNAAIYLDLLADCGICLPITSPGNNNTFHQFTVRHPRRDDLMRFLKEREVDSMIYYPVPLHFHKPYERFSAGRGALPETERACEEVLSLPVHPHLREEQVRFAAEAVAQFCNQRP